MRNFTLLIALLCLILFQSCSQADSSKKVDQKTIDEVTALLTQYSINWANAIKDKDASKIEDYFAPDFMYQEATGERIYRDEFIKGFYENPETINSFALKDVEVKLYGPDLANVTGGGSRTLIDSNGKEQTIESRFTNVWKKNSGKWQCIIGHGNPLQYGSVKSDSETANELLQVWKDYIEVANSGDVDKLMTFFADDYVNMPSFNSTQTGLKELKPFMNELLVNNKPQITGYQQIEAFVHGNMAYTFGTVDMYNYPKGGQKTLFQQRCITVYKKDAEGKWKLYRWMGQQ
jgi:ketosteroid isomerase-like protein